MSFICSWPEATRPLCISLGSSFHNLPIWLLVRLLTGSWLSLDVSNHRTTSAGFWRSGAVQNKAKTGGRENTELIKTSTAAIGGHKAQNGRHAGQTTPLRFL